MKKILFYINAIDSGGAERVMVNLSAQFTEHGYSCILVTSFRKEVEYTLLPNVKRLSLENEQIEQNQFMRNYTRIRKLRKICKNEKPDIVISFMGEPNFRALIATIGLPCKTIISIRNDPNREYSGFIRTAIAKCLFPFADGCVFQTQDAKEWFPKRLQKRSKIIVNAVNPVFFDVIRDPKDELVVTCGRLSEQKDHETLINAFAIVNKFFPEAELHIYGEGELKDKLHSIIVELGLENYIELKGQTTDVTNVLSRASIFVLSSIFEGMPNALMEAMAAGVPSISTDCPCGGPRMLIRDGIDGVLVPVRNSDKLAKEMIKLLSNPKMRKTMGDNCKNSALTYQPERVFKEWEDFIRIICK